MKDVIITVNLSRFGEQLNQMANNTDIVTRQMSILEPTEFMAGIAFTLAFLEWSVDAVPDTALGEYFQAWQSEVAERFPNEF